MIPTADDDPWWALDGALAERVAALPRTERGWWVVSAYDVLESVAAARRPGAWASAQEAFDALARDLERIARDEAQ